MTTNSRALKPLLRLRAAMPPKVREALDAMTVFFAVTMTFCLIASMINWTDRRREFDGQAWWNVGGAFVATETSGK